MEQRSILIWSHCTGDEVFGETMSLPHQPTSMWTLYHLFLRSHSASFQLNYSICSCRFGVSVVGGEFRIFLCCHLNVLPRPTMWNLSISFYHCFCQFRDPCVWLYYLVFMEIHNEAQLICYTHLIPILSRLVALIIIICTITTRIKKILAECKVNYYNLKEEKPFRN